MATAMKKRRTVITLVSIVAYAVASWICSQFMVCGYESSDRQWHAFDAPFKGVTYDGIVRSFDSYMVDKQMLSIVLCRTTAKRWAHPFAWPDYVFGRRWRLYFIEPTPRQILHERNIRELDAAKMNVSSTRLVWYANLMALLAPRSLNIG